MANFEKIDIRDMEQLTNVEFVGYADNDVVIIDDLRNFSKLQAIKVDFLLIIVIKQGRVAMRTNKEEATASSNDIIICQPNHERLPVQHRLYGEGGLSLFSDSPQYAAYR